MPRSPDLITALQRLFNASPEERALALKQQALSDSLPQEPVDIADYPHPMREGRIRRPRPAIPLQALIELGNKGQRQATEQSAPSVGRERHKRVIDLTDETTPLYTDRYNEDVLTTVDPASVQARDSRYPRI